MFVRMIWGKLKRAGWDEYSRIYHDTVDEITKDTKGFRGRQLLRSTENPNEGLSVTMWDNLDDGRAYDRSVGRQEKLNTSTSETIGCVSSRWNRLVPKPIRDRPGRLCWTRNGPAT